MYFVQYKYNKVVKRIHSLLLFQVNCAYYHVTYLLGFHFKGNIYCVFINLLLGLLCNTHLGP